MDVIFLAVVCSSFGCTVYSFVAPPGKKQLWVGIAGWLLAELVVGGVAFLVWAFASASGDLWSPSPATAHAAILWGSLACAALGALPLLELRRYWSRPAGSTDGSPAPGGSATESSA